jgi:hypothetical protein
MNIRTAAILLLICQFVTTAVAGEMRNIMYKNAFFADSGNHNAIQTPTISFVTNGDPLKGWLFASETSSNLTMSVSVDSGKNYLGTTATNDTVENNWGTSTIDFGMTPKAGLPVVVKMHSLDKDKNNFDYYSNTVAADGWCHLRALDFPLGYKSGSANVGSGVWLGWEDWIGVHDDYNDMCFILQGIGVRASDGTNTVDVKLPKVNGTRMTSWKEENVYQP